MNYNATSGARHPAQKNARKKRVSDTAAVNAPGYPPPYNPYSSPMPPGMNMYSDTNMAAPPPPPYTPESQFMPPGPDYSYMPGPSTAPQQTEGFSIPGQFLNEPLVTNVAMQYGQALVGTGKQLVDREIEKYVPVSRLKYYFAVETGYVTKKLALIFFPFTHSDWSVKYEQDEPIQPRYEINAPDLYIPTMAYITYVLLSGWVLGMQKRFTPESLGIQASSALAWAVLEIVVELITLYVTNIETKLRTLDLLAYSGYKYVGIIFAILMSIPFGRLGYWVALIYCSISLAFMLVRTLKVQILSLQASPQHNPYMTVAGNKRRLYFLLFIAGIQPVLMWWLSFHLLPPSTPPVISS